VLDSAVLDRETNPRENRYLPLRRRRVSDRARNIQSDVWLNVYAVDFQASTPQDEQPEVDLELDRDFRKLADQWYEETDDIAVIGDRFMRTTYQSIIGLGPDAVPLLLRELQQEPDYWFWALTAITRENPVPPGADFDEAVEAWLTWGRERGKI